MSAAAIDFHAAALQGGTVRLDRVSKTFGAFAAVSDLSLDIEPGEFLTLLGSSGCGKTTTLRMISGFEMPDSGTITIDGDRMQGVPPYRRPVNTVFQSYALFPHMSVEDNVAYGLTLKKMRRAEIRRRACEMLDRVGLLDKAGYRPDNLSGGQKQRVALARALVNEPRVLLLDEPLGALDAKLRREMQLELKRIQSSLGITFVYVTHDQEEALVMSDRIAVMHAGKIRQLDTPRNIFEQPSERFVAEFVGTENFLPVSIVAPDAAVLADGTRLKLAGKPAHTGSGVVAIRPQRLRLAEKGVENSVAGRLVEVVYIGAAVRLIVRLSGGETLTAEISPENLAAQPGPLTEGALIGLELPSDALLVFPEESES